MGRFLYAEQMLSLLVMDLGYTEEPVYGSSPIRHILAWKMCEDCIGVKGMMNKIEEMNNQAMEERHNLTDTIFTILTECEANKDVTTKYIKHD